MRQRTPALLALLAAVAAGGCAADWYTHDADREVYGIVAEKEADSLGRVRSFNIRPRPDPKVVLEQARAAEADRKEADDDNGSSARAARPDEAAAPGAPDGVPPSAAGKPDLGPAAAAAAAQAEELLEEKAPDLEAVIPENLPPPVPAPPEDAVRLTMAEALRVAVASSRTYQSQKEDVYLSALALTLERYLFRPHPFATGTVDYTSDYAAGTGRSRSYDPGADIGFSQQLADGAAITGSLGLAALKFLNKELGDTVDSTLDFTLSQPLWRGAGRKIVQENLLQAERNAGYAVRSFARFEKTFAVSVASEYLRVLQQRDAVMNAWNNYQSLRGSRIQAEWLARAERQAEFEVDQARQSEFTAYNRWVVERERYINAVDAFKLTLGIPVETEVALVPTELDRLHEAGVEEAESRLDIATRTALATRLDLANTRDGLDDARRKVVVAEDDLKGDVDLVASTGHASRAGNPQSARIAFSRGAYSVGFDIDMPVDRLTERNALRQTQIRLQTACRTLEAEHDDVILAVREAHRALEQARESYEIQKRSVLLAERRVESTRLLIQAGRAKQRDVLEAERDLLEARNSLTAALVNHAIAQLEFARDVGTLVVDEKGQIHGWTLTDNGG